MMDSRKEGDMRMMLLAAAAAIAATALPGPAAAQPQRYSSVRHGCGDRSCARRMRSTDAALAGDWYGGEWAEANNQSWRPGSYNDWWHEEPWRAYPRWMQHNQDCSRQWYRGDTLTC